MNDQPQGFNPKQHLIHLKGKVYLETRWRIAWFREDHPNGVISTEIISFEPVVVKATVSDEKGGILATAHAGAVDKGNAVWSGRSIEKSETAAIGRALGHAGYGTQFSGVEEDGGQQDRQERGQYQSRQQQHNQAPTHAPIVTDDLRDPATARAFIERWRGEGLTDAETLHILGVKQLREWAHGRAKADKAVDAWLLVNVPESKSNKKTA